MKVLIAEDEATSCLLLRTLFAPYGSTDTVADGNEALKAFRRALEEGQPYRLVCLDIMMPGMNGHEVLKEIRKLEVQKHIPRPAAVKVIMTTALGDPENIMKAFREDCEAYLVKPIDREKLLAKLTYLGLIKQDPQR